MKKIILICAASMYAFGLFAQTDSTKGMKHDMDNNKMDKSMYHQTTDKSQPDGVRMQKGKMMVVENGKMTTLDHEMIMSDGTKVMSDGTCIKKDGSKMMIKEGQYLDKSGNLVPVNASKDKNMYLVPDSTKKDY